MLIRPQVLAKNLQQNLKALYFLTGQDHFLLNEAAKDIQLAWQKNVKEGEKAVFTIESVSDWAVLAEKVSNYSLFADNQLMDIRYEKKTFEPQAKAFFAHFLANINPRCLLLLRAPFLGAKQLSSLMSHDAVAVVQATPLDKQAMQTWITEQLQKKAMKFAQAVPSLIWQYTQGNMLACAQVIEKLTLVNAEKKPLTVAMVKEQLVDQCNYQLFELSEACLSANAAKAMQLLKQAYLAKTEPTLILWLLTQEIRQLIQLGELTKRSISFNAACQQLKIWSTRKGLYQLVMKQFSAEDLFLLLQFCKHIDERIKLNQVKLAWQALEQVALSLCLRKQVGHFA